MSNPTPSAEELKPLFLLNPAIAFLNHGSFGATPKSVFAEYQRIQRDLEWEPVEFIGRSQQSRLDQARSKLAAYVGVPANDLVFVRNTTTGVNTIAKSLALKPGDEVLASNLEYGACNYTWERACAAAGATYNQVEIPLPITTVEAFVDAFWSAITDKTRVIFLSHITSGTAMILPVKEICAKARKAGILTVIDGAHVPGQIPLDILDLGADIYTGNCHKWLCAPKGSGFLYVHPDHQSWVHPLVTSWGYAQENPTFTARLQVQPTEDVSAYLAVPAAIQFQADHHWDAVRDRCHNTGIAIRNRLHQRFGTEPIYPDNWFGQMALVTLPKGGDFDDLTLRLYHHHGVEIPITRHNEHAFVRISVQGYVSDQDLDRLESALMAELGLD